MRRGGSGSDGEEERSNEDNEYTFTSQLRELKKQWFQASKTYYPVVARCNRSLNLIQYLLTYARKSMSNRASTSIKTCKER